MQVDDVARLNVEMAEAERRLRKLFEPDERTRRLLDLVRADFEDLRRPMVALQAEFERESEPIRRMREAFEEHARATRELVGPIARQAEAFGLGLTALRLNDDLLRPPSLSLPPLPPLRRPCCKHCPRDGDEPFLDDDRERIGFPTKD